MRIIYLHQYFNTPDMIGGTRSYEMARRLVRSGHEVHIVTSRSLGPAQGWTETEEAGIHVHWCRVPYANQISYGRRMRAFLKFAWLAARKAVTLPGDVVFATSTPLTIALPAVWTARRKSIPMVFEVRDLWPEMPIAVGALKSRPAIAAARRLERFAYRNAAAIVALSPGMKAGIVAAGYPPDRVTIIPNSCDLELFQVPEHSGRDFRSRRDWLGDRPLVVYTGTLGLINGVGYLARLAAAVRRRDPEIRFLVVGSGREAEKVRRIARRMDVLDHNFFMEPAISKADVPSVLSAADVAASVFLDVEQMWSNSANKFFDALAAGRPVAINHRGWMADMIEQTGCGLVLDAHDVDRAAKQLLGSIRDKKWLQAARASAERLAQERFNRNKLAARLQSVLLEVCSLERTQRRAA